MTMYAVKYNGCIMEESTKVTENECLDLAWNMCFPGFVPSDELRRRIFWSGVKTAEHYSKLKVDLGKLGYEIVKVEIKEIL